MLVKEKFTKMNEVEGDVAERLYLMSLHARILLVAWPTSCVLMVETWTAGEDDYDAVAMCGSRGEISCATDISRRDEFTRSDDE